MKQSDVWVLVSAGGAGGRDGETSGERPGRTSGEGHRLAAFEETLRQARQLVAPEQLVVVVDEGAEVPPLALEGLPAANVLLEPCARGSAAALLLPILRIFREAPGATVVALACEHPPRDVSGILPHALRVAARPEDVMAVLGCPLGCQGGTHQWVVPGEAEDGRARRVVSVLDDSVELDRGLLAELGSVPWERTFVARLSVLLRAYDQAQPRLLRAFLDVLARKPGFGHLREFYSVLPTIDFSRDVVARVTELLRVVPAEAPPTEATSGRSGVAAPIARLGAVVRTSARRPATVRSLGRAS